jgi:pilus assembly protein CpaE
MITAAIASGDKTTAAQLLAALEQTGMVDSVKQWSIPAEKLPDSAETLPDVVFLDLPRDPDLYFAFGVQLRRIRPAVKLVACSAASPPSANLLLEAMRSGVQDVLPKPVNSDALKEILSRLDQEIETKERPSLDKLILLMGSKGGVGTTSVAVNLAVQLSTYAKKRVVLLDFARPLGNVHLMLDLHQRFSIRDAVDNMERLDSHFFAGLLTHHKSGLEVLCGASHPEEWQTIPIPPLERIVNVAQSSFDMVLLDMGTQFSSEWATLLRVSRMILIIAEANVPSLWTLERRLLALSGFGISPERTRIIINRWHKGDDETLNSIRKEIHRPIFACVPNDFRKASQAVNLGMPLTENHNNLLSDRYRDIAGQIAGISAQASLTKRGSFFTFSGKKVK